MSTSAMASVDVLLHRRISSVGEPTPARAVSGRKCQSQRHRGRTARRHVEYRCLPRQMRPLRPGDRNHRLDFDGLFLFRAR
ncbi:hypothetical protein C8039_17500 [Halogeometricum sp. wsp3]|nr:hypothetical protein C8039_17500 [Halogeometricum sp. wsp3]